MRILKNIEIKNFRGFDYLKVDDFNDVNIFVGKNNSGKSSILEAIFLMIGMSNPQVLLRMSMVKGIQNIKADEFKYFFHDLNLSNYPELISELYTGSARTMTIEPTFEQSLEVDKNLDIDLFSSSISSGMINGIRIAFSLSELSTGTVEKYESSLKYLIDNKHELLFDKNYQEKLRCISLSSGRSSANSSLQRVTNIIKAKKEYLILDTLQQIDPKIKSIQALPDGIYFSYENIDELVKLSIAGDGVVKYLEIVSAIIEDQNHIILIDEIENGLHFSAHKQLWKSIFTLAHDFKVQLFITTHSIETLACLKELLEEEESKKDQEKINIYTVAHTKKAGVKTYKYTFEGLKDVIETNTEIR